MLCLLCRNELILLTGKCRMDGLDRWVGGGVERCVGGQMAECLDEKVGR